MSQHPTDEALLVYCEGDESRRDRKIAAHLASQCQRCSARVRAFDRILASLRTPALQRAPQDLTDAALAHIRDLQEGAAPVVGGIAETIQEAAKRAGHALNEIRMQLVQDSRLGTVLPGVRAAISLLPRQLLYESAEGSAHVQIQRIAPRRFELLGQFIPHDGPLRKRSRVLLEREGRTDRRVLGGTGEFRFASVGPGRVRLVFEWNETRVAAGPLDLHEDADA